MLEKILEEMKKIKDGNRKEKLYAKYPPKGEQEKILNGYSQGYEDGTDNFYNAMVDIIRKHINDGWIPVEERLPKESEYMGGDYRGVPWAKRLEIAYMADTVEYAHGYYDGYKWFNRRHEEIKNAMAWKIHEPYRRERPAWQEALLHTFLGGDTCGQKNTKAIPSHKAGAEAD